MPDADHLIVERNLRQTMRFFGRATGTGEVRDEPGLVLIDSGVNYSVFNIAMFTEPPPEDRADFDQRLRRSREFFEQKQERWSCWLSDDGLPWTVRWRMGEAFEPHALRRLTEAPGMVAATLTPPSRPLPEVECRRVCDLPTRQSFSHLTSIIFEIPGATCRAVYEPEHAWAGDYTGYLGIVNGVAVSTAAVVVAAGAAGLYSVGTLPGFRGRGYAEALMRQVLAETTRQTGVSRTVLQSTRAGLEMYLRMGYRKVSRFSVFLS